MANNIISEWLHKDSAFWEYIATHAVTGCTKYPSENKAMADDYAAKLDRLVKAANTLITEAKMTSDYQEWDGGTLVFAVNQLTAALREIELESK